MLNYHLVKLSFNHIFILAILLSDSHFDTLSLYHIVILTHCHCQITTLPHYHSIILSLYHIVILTYQSISSHSHCHCLILSFCIIHMPSHSQYVLSLYLNLCSLLFIYLLLKLSPFLNPSSTNTLLSYFH